MRSPPLLFLGMLLVVLPLPFVRAERFESFEELNERPPSSYEEVEEEIRRLEEYIDEGDMCGGWIDHEELKTLSGADVLTIAAGAPGRSAGSEFHYPDEVAGYMSTCHIQDPECNPDNLCLIGERTATPPMCKDLYDTLLALRDEQTRDVVCGYEIPTKFDFTETCTGQTCRCGIERTCVGDEFGLRCQDTPLEPDENNVCNPGLDVDYPICAFTPAGTLTFYCPGCKPLTYIAKIAPFYRHYGPVSSPEAIPDEYFLQGFAVKSESLEQRVAADCYEYYIEQDALTTPSLAWHKRCEVYETDDSDGETPEWDDEDFPQRDAYWPDEESEPHASGGMKGSGTGSAPFPWIRDEETGITLLDMQWDLPPNERIVNPYDIIPHLLSAPETEIVASETPGAMRAYPFDDTAERTGDPVSEQRGSAFAVWWNMQQKKLLDITHVPSIRILLPARYGFGLHADDPLVRHAAKIETHPNGIVEAHLRAGDDVLGAILSSLHQSPLLSPKEVKIPVLVPLASEQEINATIHDWRQWEVRYDRKGDADDLVRKLEMYRGQLRYVRLLRNALSSYVSEVLSVEEEVRGFFAEWYLRNARNIAAWTEDAEERSEVQEKWRQVMNVLIELHDGCELKWCSNARYTTSTYSLLDPWLPGRPALDALLSDAAYQLPEWEVQPDKVIDFSAISLPHEYYYLPSLEVIQAKVHLPLPPLGNGPVPNAELLPEIPGISTGALLPEVTIFEDTIAIPTVNSPALDPGQHLVPLPPEQNYSEALEKLVLFETMITEARKNYCEFRDSVEERDDQPRKIVHTEYDLRERIERLFARRAPLRKEDYTVRDEGAALSCGNSSDPTVACRAPAPEESLSFRWGVRLSPDSPDRFNEVYDELRDTTLPENEEKNPYTKAPLEWLKRMFLPDREEDASPDFRDIDLVPSLPPPPEES